MTALPHPPEFARLCAQAVEQLRAFEAAPLAERGARLADIRARLTEIGTRMAELDIRAPGFPDEQATLADATSALLALDVDRGGPRVARYVERIIADLQRISGG